MLAHQLVKEVERMKLDSLFDGIYSIDNFTNKLKNKHFIIINTDISSGPGKHWFCVVKVHNVIECFDSLGIKEQQKKLLCDHFSVFNNTHIIFNTTQVQSYSSVSCGQFVLYFLFERYLNLDLGFHDLLNECFTGYVKNNEDIVQNFVLTHLTKQSI